MGKRLQSYFGEALFDRATGQRSSGIELFADPRSNFVAVALERKNA